MTDCREGDVLAPDERTAWLVALDIDGTTIGHNGTLSRAVITEARRLVAVGHHVTFATGRSFGSTAPILDMLGIHPDYLVCSNGAVTLARDASAPGGYNREWVEYFDPTEVLEWFRADLRGARFALEGLDGRYLHTEPVPNATIGHDSRQVRFDELLHTPTTRLVVMSHELLQADVLDAVERIGLRDLTFAVGWTAWVDISAEGVDKATAMERVRARLGIPRSRVMAVGDGRNDIALVDWAATHGRGVAMGGSPSELVAAASELTGGVLEDGLATVLATV
jgi:Cof subfamily protein (haloacid dehalogenase superfamily)